MIRNTKIQLILLIVAFVSAFSSCTKEASWQRIPCRFSRILRGKLSAPREIRVEAWPQEHFLATVQNISPVVDEASRTVETILRFDDSTAKIVQYFSSVAEREVRKYKTIVASTGTSEMEEMAGQDIDIVIRSNDLTEAGKFAKKLMELTERTPLKSRQKSKNSSQRTA